MLEKALSYFLYLYGLLYQAIVPCSFPELLPVNTVNRQQYLGKWYFKAAVSHREADIQKFKALDNILFSIEETANNTLLLTGFMRMGDNCINKNWTYHLHPEREDMELEGKPERKNLLWTGKWANCANCIIFQEVEPPLKETDTVDSLNRFMLYARQSDVDSEVVTTFLKNSACQNMLASVKLPQSKELRKKTPSHPHYKPMSKGKPCQPDMSLREKQQMNLDTESATHTGMEGQSRCSHKYLLLQVWCGLLTVAMVVMAAFLTSIKSKSTEDEVPTLKPDHVSPTFNTLAAPLKSARSSLSYIQLIKSLHDNVWQESPECPSCSLYLGNNSIHCKENSFYLIYAQVTFTKHQSKNPAKSVILRRDATFGKSVMKLVEGTFPSTTEGSVWVAKIVSLTEGDSISLHITDDFLKDSTFWGAYKLQ